MFLSFTQATFVNGVQMLPNTSISVAVMSQMMGSRKLQRTTIALLSLLGPEIQLIDLRPPTPLQALLLNLDPHRPPRHWPVFKVPLTRNPSLLAQDHEVDSVKNLTGRSWREEIMSVANLSAVRTVVALAAISVSGRPPNRSHHPQIVKSYQTRHLPLTLVATANMPCLNKVLLPLRDLSGSKENTHTVSQSRIHPIMNIHWTG